MGSRLEANSSRVRKRIENHTFDNYDGEEYSASTFGGFGDYFRRKKIKLQNLDVEIRANVGDKPQIFKGVVAHVNGYTQPPLNILHRELVQHGAGFLQYLDSKTMATHIIASALTMKKAVEFKHYRVVKPAWVTDSIKAGRLLPWSNYRVIDEGPGQKMLNSMEGNMVCQPRPSTIEGYREHTDLSLYANYFNSLPDSVKANLNDRAVRVLSSKQEDADTPSRDISHSRPIRSDDNLTTTSSAEKVIERPTLNDTSATNEMRAEEKNEPEMNMNDGGQSPEEGPGPPKNLTSEEHNAWLLSDPKLRKASCANPNFLQQFYSESRLHHLSTWKAELKSRMQRMAAENGLAAKVSKRKPGSRRYILHVDFDSFFCAVSLKKAPEFVDKPTVVAHGSGNGSEIASSNYPARKFGVKNGMWMKRALELCPDLKVLPYDFPGYEEASRQFYEAIIDVGGVVQSVSVDEALVDVTTLLSSVVDPDSATNSQGIIDKEHTRVDEIVFGLRERIKAKTGCAVSVGIGGNILLAKVALRRAKPAGQYHLRPEDALDFIGELRIEDLPGFAQSLGGKLEEIGVRLVKDARQVTKERLSAALGPKTGEKLWEYARGIDRVEVGEQPPRKSVSAEINWGIRFTNQQEADDFVRNLCKELERRLVEEQVKGKQLTVKIMRRALDAPLDPAKHLGHGRCDTFNKSIIFGVATNNGETVAKEAVSILRGFSFSPGDLRGLGVHMGKLEPVKYGGMAYEGSQKRLTFGGVNAPLPKRQRTDGIEVAGSHRLLQSQVNPNRSGGSQAPLEVTDDPIADFPNSPQWRKSNPRRASLPNRTDLSSGGQGAPLNISGTQFILPSNPDLTVLAALPSDIRKRLMRQGETPNQRIPTSPPASRGPFKNLASPSSPIRLPSDIDLEVFSRLPETMKAEILAAHRSKPERPSTPLREPPAASMKKPSPMKQGGIRGMLGKVQELQRDAEAGLMQTSLLSKWQSEGPQLSEDIEKPDEDFLNALPSDVRREVLADYHRQSLRFRRSGTDAPVRQQVRQHDAKNGITGGEPRQTTLDEWPPPPPKVFFLGGLTTAEEVKDLLEAWHANTRSEGPHSGDLDVFERYLVGLVLEERDMEKAARLVKFLEITVELEEGVMTRETANHESSSTSKDTGGFDMGRESWRKGVRRIKEAVRNAVRQRGLGTLTF